MSEKIKVGIMAAPDMEEPAVQQQPLAQRRFARQLYAAFGKYSNVKKFTEYEVELLEFVMANSKISRTSGDSAILIRTNGADYLSLAASWEKWFKRGQDWRKYDILVVGSLETCRLALDLRHSGCARRVIYVANHLLRPLQHWGITLNKEYLNFESWYLNEVDAVVFPSESHIRQYLTYYSPDPHIQTCLIPHGVVRLGKEQAAEKSAIEECAVVFMASPVHPQSDYATALYALRRIVAGHSGDVKLRIAGTKEWDSPTSNPGTVRSILAQITTELNLWSQLEFLGYLSPQEMQQQYQQAHVTIVTSVIEAFGDIVAESLSEGTPVVATNTGAIPEFVRTELQGYIVPPRSPWIVAESVLEVLGRYVDRKRTSRQIITDMRQSLTRMTWDGTADKYASLFSDVLSPKYRHKAMQRAASNEVRARLKRRLKDHRWSIRDLTEKLGDKTFESVRRVFDEDAAPSLRWSTVEPIAKMLCREREVRELKNILMRSVKN